MNTGSYRSGGRILLLGIVVYFLIASRCMGLAEIPAGLNPNGAVSALDAKALAEYGTDRLGTNRPTLSINGDSAQMSTMMSYVMIPFVKSLGLNIFSMRLPILMFSLLGSAAIYGIVRRMLGDAIAVIALLFVAINPWHMMQSRFLSGTNLFPHMVVIGVYLLLKGMEKVGYFYVSMLFFSLSMYCSDTAFYFVPLFLITMLLTMVLYQALSVKTALIGFLVYMGVAWPAFLTVLVNFMKWETISLPFVTIQSFAGNVGVTDILFCTKNPLEQLPDNVVSLINVVFAQNEELLWPSLQTFGTMYQGAAPLILLGWGVVVYMSLEETKLEKKIAYIALLLYSIFALFSGIIMNGVNTNKMNIIFYVNIIFMVIGIWFIVSHWKTSLVLFVGIFGISSVFFFYRYFTTWEEQKNTVYYSDFCEAVCYAKDHRSTYYYITPDTGGEEETKIISELLTMFTFEIDAKYYLGETNEWHGEKLSYQNKFLYRNPPAYPSKTGDITYVFKASDSNRFSDAMFFKTMFGEYGVAIPKKIKQ